jgi:hypothetical protein
MAILFWTLPGAAAVAPSIAVISSLNAGSVMPGTSAGTLVLTAGAGGSETRSVTGGTQLGGTPVVTLGSFTLTGKGGDTFLVTATGVPGLALTGPGGRSLTVSSLNFASPYAGGTGAFPAGRNATTTPALYLGATLVVGASTSLVSGTYTGSLILTVRDTATGRQGTASLTCTAVVDPTPITLANLSGLSFGDVFANATGGTVLLTPAGIRTATGGLVLASTGTVGAATFTVGGAKSATYAITLPTGATLTGPSGTMAVKTFTSTPSGTGLLSATGTQALAVGATLTVGANQADGNYAGTFPVTVAYN